MFSSILVTLILSASALANVFMTSPVESTNWTGGQQNIVAWQDDGKSPDLKSFGPSSISIYTGNAKQQTLLQIIATNIDVSTTSSLAFTPNPSIGPNGHFYFIRVQSNSLKDSTNSQYLALAFSASFSLQGMNGKFNSSVQAQVDGQSTAPIVAPTPAPGSANAAAAAVTTPPVSAATTVSSIPLPTGAANGASNIIVAGSSALTGVAVFLGSMLL